MSGTSFTAGSTTELNAALAAIAGGAASYTITLTADIALDADPQAITLANGGTLSINGAGHSLSGGLAHRGLFAFSGTTFISNLSFSSMAARGGDGAGGVATTNTGIPDSGATGGGGGAGLGGALFVAGPNVVGGQTLTTGAVVVTSNVNFLYNGAIGGSGTAAFTNDTRVRGGGGGLGGRGGSGDGGAYASGGGGGLGSGATGAGASSFQGTGTAPGQGILAGAGGGAAGAGGGLGASGANGGFGGGGGAGTTGGGTGGFGGGGGSGGTGVGGAGGFGGGGGVGDSGGGLGGWGGGNGFRAAHATSSGGGGLAAGGAIFVQQGGQLVIAAGTMTGNYIFGGSGASYGAGVGGQFGGGLFIQGNNAVLLAPPFGTTLVITNSIADQAGADPGGLRWHQPASGVLSVTGGGTVVLNGNNSGNNPFTGGISIAGATLRLGAQSAAGTGLITFTTATTDRLIIGSAIPANTVVGFDPEDTLAFPNIAPGSVTVSQSGTDTLIAGLKVRGSFTQGQLAITSDGSGGALVSLACFAAGTRILTDRGEIPVEALRPGDRVATRLGGRLAPVAWIGHRTLDCRRHPNPASVHPIRIRAGAFAPGTPHRDLLLSPDHAVLAGAAPPVLVPIHALVNGATIRQEPAGRITYFHVELDRHDVLLAEGLPCESYLDTGNRAAFANAPATALHPDFAARSWDAVACALLALDGPAVAAARARLLARAPARQRDPALGLSCHGHPIRPGPDGTLALPPGARLLRLRSRIRVAAWTEPQSNDWRPLGVALAALAADDAPLALDSARFGAGWHAPEPGLRWTNGDACLDVAGLSRVRLNFAPIGEYSADSEYMADGEQLSRHG